MRHISLLLLVLPIVLSAELPSGYALSGEPVKETAAAPAINGESDEYVLLVFLKPIKERLAEFYRWYYEDHMQEVVDRLGFVSGRIYTNVDFPYLPPQNPPNPNVIKYDIKTSDLKKFFEVDQTLSEAARLEDPPLETKATVSFTYQKIGKQFTGAGPKKTGNGELKTYVFISFNGPKAGQEEAFNIWYDKHVAEVIATQGFVSGQRYQRSAIQRYSGKDSAPNMVIYTIVTDNLQSVFEALNERHKDFVISDAIDSSKSSTCVYEAASPLMERK